MVENFNAAPSHAIIPIAVTLKQIWANFHNFQQIAQKIRMLSSGLGGLPVDSWQAAQIVEVIQKHVQKSLHVQLIKLVNQLHVAINNPQITGEGEP